MTATIYLTDMDLMETFGVSHQELPNEEARELMEYCLELKPHARDGALRARMRELGMHKPMPVYEELSEEVTAQVTAPLPAWGFIERRHGCWAHKSACVRVELTRYSIWVNDARYTHAEQALMMIARHVFT